MLSDLPDHIRDIILAKFVALKPSAVAYMWLACASKDLYSIMNAAPMLKAMVDIHRNNNQFVVVDAMPYKEQLLFYAHHVCKFCKAPRVRNIYPAFGCRSCRNCLDKRILSYSILRYRYHNIVQVDELDELLRTCRKMGTNYWIEDVKAAVGKLDEAKIALLEQQPDYESFGPKQCIKESLSYKWMRPATFQANVWDNIKQEARKIHLFRSVRAFSKLSFVPLLSEHPSIVNALKPHSDVDISDTRAFLNSVVRKLLVVELNERSNTCSFCAGNQRFSWEGLVNHQWKKHPHTICRYIKDWT
jgi:hypothetical protein